MRTHSGNEADEAFKELRFPRLIEQVMKSRGATRDELLEMQNIVNEAADRLKNEVFPELFSPTRITQNPATYQAHGRL